MGLWKGRQSRGKGYLFISDVCLFFCKYLRMRGDVDSKSYYPGLSGS